MTGNAINTRTEALELHELSSEELDAVSGGSKNQAQLENKQFSEALRVYRQVLDSL